MRVHAPVRLLGFALLNGVIFACALSAQPVPSVRDVPPKLKPPDGQSLLWQWIGKGKQIYVCQDSGGGYAWKLKAPDAKLLDAQGRLQGRHFSGPSWEANDGSRVTGKVVASVASPDSGAIPWLLVTAAAHSGAGKMSAVETIQRRETEGGLAPAETCNAAGVDSEVPVVYEANYYFYGNAGK